jgi:hypothetical protein
MLIPSLNDAAQVPRGHAKGQAFGAPADGMQMRLKLSRSN